MNLKNIIFILVLTYFAFFLFGSMFIDSNINTNDNMKFVESKIATSKYNSSLFTKKFEKDAFNPSQYLAEQLESIDPNNNNEINETFNGMVVKTLNECKNNIDNSILIEDYLTTITKYLRDLNKVHPSSDWKEVATLNNHLYSAIQAFHEGNDSHFIRKLEESNMFLTAHKQFGPPSHLTRP